VRPEGRLSLHIPSHHREITISVRQVDNTCVTAKRRALSPWRPGGWAAGRFRSGREGAGPETLLLRKRDG
jgi:hypothetical protein